MTNRILLTCLLLLLAAPVAAADDGKKEAAAKGGPPPMLVAVGEIVAGSAEPMQEMVGTVFFARVSKVAAEVEGLVAGVSIDDGDRVEAGAPLVSLQTDFIDTALAKTRALYEQADIDLRQARKDLERLETLHADRLIAETTYDTQLARAQGLEKRAEGLQADLQRLQLEKEKMVIRSPFRGVVLERDVEKGEWVKLGSTVAEVADDSVIDVVVEVPERQVAFLRKGREVKVASGGRTFSGTYVALVPKGDIATRTFSIKIRMKNSGGLIEGMAARVLLPVSAAQEGLLVPRDAVINKFGRDVVFIVVDGAAKMIPVEITGYSGMQLGVNGDGLEVGQKVVVKGQERIFADGTPVRFGS